MTDDPTQAGNGNLPAATAAWRVLARAVADAIDIPLPASGSDEDTYWALRSDRANCAVHALRQVLADHRAGSSTLLAAADILRAQCATFPPDTYAHSPVT